MWEGPERQGIMAERLAAEGRVKEMAGGQEAGSTGAQGSPGSTLLGFL